MSKIFTFPGMMGDILMQWPVAYQWHKKTSEDLQLFTCEHWGCPRVINLLASQACVTSTTVVPGRIMSDHCGGQPWDFGIQDPSVYHLGYRSKPLKQLTEFTLDHFPEELDADAVLNEPSLDLGARDPKDYCVFFTKPHQNWLIALRLMEECTAYYDKVYVIGLPVDLQHIRENSIDEISEKWHYVDRKHPDLLADAMLIRDARMVITLNSLVPTISNVLKVPTVVVHRAQPFEVYSNTGPDQFNYFPAHDNDLTPAMEFLENVGHAR